jgi:hypothetical protein
MAFRLQDHVIDGFISGSGYETHGALTLAGVNSPIILSLTCDPGPMLRGRMIDFRAKDPSKVVPLLHSIEPIQVGITGEMNLRMVKVPRIPIEEWDHKSPLECDWELCLYLEWFSQNGRVVIELVDPVILLRAGDPIEIPEIPEGGGGGFSFFVIREVPDEGSGEKFEVKGYTLVEEEEEDEGDLDSYLERLNRERDAAVGASDEDDLGKFLEIEGEKFLNSQEDGEYLGSLLEPRQLPHPNDVSEEEAEILFKSILMELALRAVSVHLCAHCDMRQAYRYLVETVLQEGRADPTHKPNGWVITYCYGETCPQCEAEVEILEEWRQEGFPPRMEDGKAEDGELPF